QEEKTVIERTVDERTRELAQKNIALHEAKEEISQNLHSLRREQTKLTASLNSLSLGFIMIDESEEVLMTNHASLQILSVETPILSLGDFLGLFGDASNLSSAFSACRKGGKPIQITPVSYKDTFMRLFLTPITLRGVIDEYIGTAILLEDITQAKLLEDARDEFFTMASHELRTPLSSIRWNLEMLLAGKIGALPKSVIGNLESSYQTTHHMVALVNDLLNISKVAQGNLFEKKEIDVCSSMQRVVTELTPDADAREIAMTLGSDCGDLPVFLEIDPRGFHMVMENLISNSIKYNHPHGRTQIFVRKSGGTVSISITDTGIGIPKEDQDKIFHKFYRAGNVGATSGTGLGLYIVKSYLEKWGGTIAFTSRAGSGTTFTLAIPAVQKSS
ncbi:MAG: HAMP domain-containing sensor histidine kinase, partial [bacterium]|nr:HAMP domain-containing sensor histidine kinase [bacterium]